MNIDEIKENITDNTYLSDVAKQELLSKLDEIVELQKSKESKTKKWDKAKSILAFLLDNEKCFKSIFKFFAISY